MPATTRAPDPADLAVADEFAATVREQLRVVRRAQAELGKTLAAFANSGTVGAHGFSRVQPWLVDIGNMGKPLAKALMKRARALHPRQDGPTLLPALAPLTGAAAAEGLLSEDTIDVIIAALDVIPAEHHDTAEPQLVAMARQGGPDQVREVGERILGHVRPDGSAPEYGEPARDPERSCLLRKKRRGGWRLEADVDEMAGALMNATIEAKSQRRTGDDGPDTRSLTQRRGDALVEVFDLALNSPDLPTQAGERVHVTVTVRTDVLRSAMGRACLDLTGEISAWEARIWACDCTLIPASLDADGEVLELGRARRLISPGQRRALYLRDRGCAFPGCNRPPRNCHGHHIVAWDHGGPTDLNNLVLLCAHHHRKVHRTGWDVRIAPDGLPEFVPPHWLDPCRQPRRNTMHPPIAL